MWTAAPVAMENKLGDGSRVTSTRRIWRQWRDFPETWCLFYRWLMRESWPQIHCSPSTLLHWYFIGNHGSHPVSLMHHYRDKQGTTDTCENPVSSYCFKVERVFLGGWLRVAWRGVTRWQARHTRAVKHDSGDRTALLLRMTVQVLGHGTVCNVCLSW